MRYRLGSSWTLFFILTLLLSSILAAQAPVDVLHYDIDVLVEDQEISETVTITARAKKIPRSWTLALTGSMKVGSVQSGGKAIPFKAALSLLKLDLSGLASQKASEIKITVEAVGRPHVKFSKNRGGYVRTCITPEIAYIRSQHPWYPRVKDDAATYRVAVRVKDAWTVRTAGAHEVSNPTGGQRTWTFRQKTPVRGIGLVAGPYETITLKGTPAGKRGFDLDALVLQQHSKPYAKSTQILLGVAQRAGDFYGKLFGPVDSARYTLVEMPKQFGSGSGYGEAGYVLIGEGAFKSAGEASWASSLVAHEVSHSWWGHEVAFANFASESLASYATLAFIEKEGGEAAARRERREAVERVLKAAAAGKEVRLADIKAWGSGMDPVAYRVHAYEKGMMILAMIEWTSGEKALQKTLRGLIEEHRGKTIDYSVLRKALLKCGRGSRALLTQWENPGIPELELESKTKVQGKGKRTSYRTSGTLTQKGTKKPFRMKVEVVAICGEQRFPILVEMKGRKKTFNITTPSKPDKLLVDPDYRLLAKRPTLSPSDLGIDLSAIIRKVVNGGESDPKILEKAIAKLETVARSNPSPKDAAICHTGLGRCRFRLGQFDAAITSFKKALELGAGGPFHRAWVYLRMGNIADLAKDRKKAKDYYKRSAAQGKKYWQARKAEKYLDKPYRGYKVDG